MKSGYCRMEEIVGQVKWTTTNHTKGRSSSKEGGYVYGGIGRESSIMSSFRKTKPLIPTSTAPN